MNHRQLITYVIKSKRLSLLARLAHPVCQTKYIKVNLVLVTRFIADTDWVGDNMAGSLLKRLRVARVAMLFFLVHIDRCSHFTSFVTSSQRHLLGHLLLADWSGPHAPCCCRAGADQPGSTLGYTL
jgi:hypothetical protein